MKKIVLSLVCAVLLLASGTVGAQNVAESEARNVAAAYIASLQGEKMPYFDNVRCVKTYVNPATGDNALYVFNVGDNAYAVVSGVKSSDPVLLYSDEDTIDVNRLGENEAFENWIQHYADMVSYAQLQGLTAPTREENAERWESLGEGRVMQGLYSKPTKGDNPKLLVKTWWDQGTPYNLQCPIITNDGGQQQHCVVGCVALAMGMVVRYWEYPNSPMGLLESTRPYSGKTIKVDLDTMHYDFSLMPNTLKTTSSAEEKYETSKFLLHCGLAVKSQYSLSGTGSGLELVAAALTNNFKFTGHRQVERASMTNDEWVALMKKEITEGRPIVYRAADNGSSGDHAGHAFVIAGYNSDNGKFRVNFGWGASAAPWCDLSEIDGLISTGGGGYYMYSSGQGAIVNIMPPADSIRVPLPAGAVVAAGQNTDERPTVEFGKAYPNPTCFPVTFEYKLHGVPSADLVVYDMQGKEMTRRTLYEGEHSMKVEVDKYPSGLYIFKCDIDRTKAFVVQVK